MGFHADLLFEKQLESDSPTLTVSPSSSPRPSITESVAPSVSDLPSESPSRFPSRSVSPTVSNNQRIDACVCNNELECVPSALVAGSHLRICLISQPQIFTLEKILLAAIRRENEVLAIVRNDNAIDPHITSIRPHGTLRRRVVEIDVPDVFFKDIKRNDADNSMLLLGTGVVLRTGSTTKHEVKFSLPITLLADPSEAPSMLPSSSSHPTVDGPTLRPTQSLSLTSDPAATAAPTEEQTVGLDFFACDVENNRIEEQDAILSPAMRSISVCVQASPSNSILNVTHVFIRDGMDTIDLLTEKISSDLSVVTGTLPSNYQGSDITIVGITDLFVPEGKR